MGKTAASQGFSVDSEVADILDELADRLAAGEEIDLAPYRLRLPAQAQLLEQAYESLRQLMGISSADVQGDCRPTSDVGPSLPVSFPDFQLLREIGRGGIGVVYEARQLSLDRRIAVKILPLAGLLTERQLDRFRNESRATAMLTHPHIVRVYASGCEHGLHYYAMDLIEGGTVADVVRELWAAREGDRRGPAGPIGTPALGSDRRPPQQQETARSCEGSTHRLMAPWSTDAARGDRRFSESVARLGATVADALQYAHEQGVIHRDIKPSNLLLDCQGRPYLADFGLAHVQGDPSLTATGDRIGTLRYMSPEQARGCKVLDHRTDIYSLGATLYELLTLRPPFVSDDRVQLLREVESVEPRSIRSVSPSVPRDLETIVHKAMAKAPEYRYATALELADDLRRFLDQQPVRARRTRWGQRAWRWVLRHRVVATLAANTACLFLILATAGPLAAWRYARLAKHEAQARASSEQLSDELQSLVQDTLTTTMESLENLPKIDPLHEQLVTDTVERQRKLLELDPDDPDLRLKVANGLIRLARVIKLRFGRQLAHELLQEAVDLLGPNAPIATNPDARLALCDANLTLGISSWSSEPLRKCVRIATELVHEHPEQTRYQVCLGWGQQYLGGTLASEGWLREGERYIEQSVATFEQLRRIDPAHLDYLHGYLGALHFLARVHYNMRQFQKADAEFREVLTTADTARDTLGSQIRVRIGLGDTMIYHGKNLVSLHRHGEAEVQLRSAVKYLTDIVDGFPESGWANSSLAYSQLSLAQCLTAMGRIVDAEQMFRLSVATVNRYHQEDAKRPIRSEAHYQYGCLLWRLGRSEQARMELAEGLRLARAGNDGWLLAQWYATCPDPALRDPAEALRCARLLGSHSPEILRILGIAEYRAGFWREATATLRRAHLGGTEEDAVCAFYLSMAFAHLNDLPAARHWYEQAVGQMRPDVVPQLDLVVARQEADEVLRLHVLDQD